MPKNNNSRSYCFTLFYESSAKPQDKAFELTDKIRYIIWQTELCPKTGNLHYQGYAELNVPMRMKAFKDAIGYNSLHLEERGGTRDQARNYCMKSDTHVAGPWELGEWTGGGQGKRTDMDEAAKLVRDKGIDAVADAMPGVFMKYQKHIREYQNYLNCRTQPISREIFCFWVHGPTDIGKSHLVYNSVGDLYALCPGTGQNWYDGYNRQQGLLIDDLMANTIPASDMLHIADKWNYRCPIKGGFVWARWNLVVVTCNSSIYSVYAGTSNIESIIRRFKLVPVQTREDCEAAAVYIQKCVTDGFIPKKAWNGNEVGGNTGPHIVPPDDPPRLMRHPADFAHLNKFN